MRAARAGIADPGRAGSGRYARRRPALGPRRPARREPSARQTASRAPPDRPLAVPASRARACPSGSAPPLAARCSRRLVSPARGRGAPTRPSGPHPAIGNRGEVDRSGERRHLIEQVGIACEVERLGAVHDEADRVGLDAQRPPATVVTRGRGDDAQVADRRLLPGAQLLHASHPASRQPPPRATRSEHDGRRAEGPQRREVGVVEVKVREEHGVDPLSDQGTDRGSDPSQRAHAISQRGVGEDARCRRARQAPSNARPTSPRATRRASRRTPGGI